MSRLLFFLRGLATGWLLCFGAAPAQAGPVPWPDAPFSYFTEGTPLQSVLAEFAGSFSLALALQPGLSGTVSGRFTAKNPTEFISRMGGVYGFQWYTHAGTLHVSRASETQMRTLPLPARGTNANLRQALTDLGIVEPRFGWGELPDQGVVMVSGPASYVGMIESTLRQMPAALSAQQVTVFRLRHASAEDRVVTYRDRQMTQPGLATVLRQLVQGGRAGAGGALGGEMPAPSTATATPGSLGGAGAGGATGAEPSGSTAQDSRSSGAAAGGAGSTPSASVRVGGDSRARVPSIQSDPRLNALIVQDLPERMPIYERLIAELDVPSALIEIEAMIIDVNTDRARELGINWSFRGGSLAAGFGVVGPPAAGTISLIQASGAGLLVPGTVPGSASSYLLGQIRLLENQGDARIQSRPSVLTTDNIGALLDLSETFYIRVTGERVATVTQVTAGTTLKVTPRLVAGPEPSIQLTIDIEDGQIQDRQVDTLPTVRRSTVSTQAVVRQEETLLIAGYSSDQNIEAQQKVPWLGDLPGVGLLFSTRSRVVQKRERLFMIKPRLVTPTFAPAAALETGAPLKNVALPGPAAPEPAAPGPAVPMR